jgi:hypothetical protein
MSVSAICTAPCLMKEYAVQLRRMASEATMNDLITHKPQPISGADRA